MTRVCLWGLLLCLSLALVECRHEFFSASSSTGPRTWFKGEKKEDQNAVREFKRQESVSRRQSLRNAAHTDSKRDLQSDLESIFNVDSYLFKKFGVGAATADEHECFKGFNSIKNTRCANYLKNYGPIGSTRVFTAPYGGTSNFTLRSTPSFLNIWTTKDVTDVSMRKLTDIANFLVNPSNSISLFPQTPFGGGGQSMLEAECRALGPLPFWMTCSDRLNILAYECVGTTNAFASFSDVVSANFPDPGNQTNNDNIIYFCQGVLTETENLLDISNTAVHEISHILQFPRGDAFTPFTEGGATFAESALFGSPFRPLYYGSSNGEGREITDWVRLGQTHLYSTTTNNRKFYQLHSMFISYLSQWIGMNVFDLWRAQYYFPDRVVSGREIYEIFVQSRNWKTSADYKLPVQPSNDYAATLGYFRAALAATCLGKKPADELFHFPSINDNFWNWQCSEIENFPTSNTSSVGPVTSTAQYGGARLFRLSGVTNPKIDIVGGDAASTVFVFGEYADTSKPTFAQVLSAGTKSSVQLTGDFQQVLVVHVNNDPNGEFITQQDVPNYFHKSTYNAFEGNSWGVFTAVGTIQGYKDGWFEGLKSPKFTVPSSGTTTLSFKIKYGMEAIGQEETKGGCVYTAYDGAWVKVIKADNSSVSISPNSGDLYQKAIYTADPSICQSGWTGNTNNAYVDTAFDLSTFAGQTIQFEILFSSDSGWSTANDPSLIGLFVDNIKIANGATTILEDNADDKSVMIPTSESIPISLNGKRDALGRPYTLEVPSGVFPDYLLIKETVTKSAVWSASWTPTSFSQAPRQWIGTNTTSGVSPIVIVHPWEEVTLELTAPYNGKITSAFFGFVQDCAGVTAGKISIRNATAPYDVITTEIVQTSQAVLCYHPGFLTAHFTQPAFLNAGQKFLLTYTPISAEKEIVKQADPFYWFSSLPTTDGPSITKILTTQNRSEYKAVAGTMNANVASGYNVIGRAFFEAAAVPSACPTPAPTTAPTAAPTTPTPTCPACPSCPTTAPTAAPTTAPPATCPPCSTPEPCPSCPLCPTSSQKSVINVNFAGMLKKN